MCELLGYLLAFSLARMKAAHTCCVQPTTIMVVAVEAAGNPDRALPPWPLGAPRSPKSLKHGPEEPPL